MPRSNSRFLRAIPAGDRLVGRPGPRAAASLGPGIHDAVAVLEEGGQVAAGEVAILVDGCRQNASTVAAIPGWIVRSPAEEGHSKWRSCDNHAEACLSGWCDGLWPHDGTGQEQFNDSGGVSQIVGNVIGSYLAGGLNLRAMAGGGLEQRRLDSARPRIHVAGSYPWSTMLSVRAKSKSAAARRRQPRASLSTTTVASESRKGKQSHRFVRPAPVRSKSVIRYGSDFQLLEKSNMRPG